MQDYSHTNPLVPPETVRSWLEAIRQPIAITGGTGFVGSHLVDLLCAAGIEPRVLVRDPDSPRWIADSPVHWVVGSLAETENLRRLVEGAGTVFHLAGVLRAGHERDFDTGNRLGTANLVSAMREVAGSSRLVNVSSLAAAGPSPDPEGVGPEVRPRGRTGANFLVWPIKAGRRAGSAGVGRGWRLGCPETPGDLRPTRHGYPRVLPHGQPRFGRLAGRRAVVDGGLGGRCRPVRCGCCGCFTRPGFSPRGSGSYTARSPHHEVV
jgi:hypothetical protein